MGRKLVVTTVVSGDPAGEPFTVLGPDDDVPAWAAEQMGDHCFEPEPESEKKPARKTSNSQN